MVVLWSFKMPQAVPLPLGETRQCRKVQLVYNTRDIEQRAAIVELVDDTLRRGERILLCTGRPFVSLSTRAETGYNAAQRSCVELPVRVAAEQTAGIAGRAGGGVRAVVAVGAAGIAGGLALVLAVRHHRVLVAGGVEGGRQLLGAIGVEGSSGFQQAAGLVGSLGASFEENLVVR